MPTPGQLSRKTRNRRRHAARRSHYYDGPISDHFDGARFFDPEGAAPRSRADLLRWMIGSRWRGTRAKWPAWAPSPYVDHPPARVDGESCRISYVGHASWLVQTAGINLLLDPVWSQRASPFRRFGPKRVNDPGSAFSDLPPIDLVLVSLAHDHVDLLTLSRLAAAHHCRVITRLGNDTITRNYDPSIAAEGHDWDQRVEIAAGTVTPVPTRHWSTSNLSDRDMSLWASFVAYEPRWFMRDQHMNPAEAVQLCSIAAPRRRSRATMAPSSSPMRQSTRQSLRSPMR